MNKIAKIAAAASVLFVPFTAHALPADGTYIGPVTVTKGLVLNCTLTTVISGGDVTSIALSGGLCPVVTFNSLPYDVVDDPSVPGKIAIKNADVNTITSGGCYGDVVGSYSGNSITLAATGPDAIPPKTGGTGSCSIVGTITK